MRQMWFEDSRFIVKRDSTNMFTIDNNRVVIVSEMLYRCYNSDEKLQR